MQGAIFPRLAGIAAIYFAMAALSLSLTRIEGGFALLWCATAYLFVELGLRDRRQWPAILIACGCASATATAFFGLGPKFALPLALINMGEAALGAAIVGRAGAVRETLDSGTGLLRFIGGAGILAPSLTGLGAAAALVANGRDFWTSWAGWSIGHGLDMLIVAPIILLVLSGQWREWLREAPRSTKAGTAGLLLLHALVALGVFAQSGWPLLFVPVLPLVILTVHSGRFGASIGILLLALIGGAATATDRGPIILAHQTSIADIQFFQFYIAVCFLIALPAAVELAMRRRLYQRLGESEARYRLIADNSGDVIMNIGVDGIIGFVSPSVAAFGYTPEQLIGSCASAMVHDDDVDHVLAIHRRALAEPGLTLSMQYRGRLRDGSWRWLETITRAVADERGAATGVVSCIRDIQDRKRAEIELSAAANTDSLTGTANRRAFMAALDARIVRGTSGCLALLDIDHFKRINDRHGHVAGDEALRQFVERVKPHLRGTDLLGRLGGEEFALILCGATLTEATAACDRLLQAVARKPLDLGDSGPIPLTFSIGLVEISSARSAHVLLDAADRAMYRAKAEGRNCMRLAA